MKTMAYDVAIDRTGPFGNPYPLRHERDRAAVLQRYREYFLDRVERDLEFRRRVLELRGKRLGCHCAGASPKPCHGMVIVEWLEANAA